MELSLSSLQNIIACPGCFGAEGELAIAANTAIGMMLILLVFVLGSFLAFIFFLAKKSKQVQQEILDAEADPDNKI